MKLFKLFVSTLFGIIMATLGLTAFSAYADNTPTISTELEYVDSTSVKATIYMSDFAPVCCGGFHIQLGNGFIFDIDNDFGGIIKYNCQGTTSALVGNASLVGNAGGRSAFVTFLDPDAQDENINGAFLEVFLKRVPYSSNFDLTFNVLLLSNEYVTDFFSDYNGYNYYHVGEVNVPYMYKSAQYMFGDVDGNGVVNSADATAIDTLLSQPPYSYNISNIENTYVYLFPNAEDSWALDPNQNGYLSNADSVAITQYLAQINSYSGDIGGIFYHCYYTTYYS